jgi:hypothetical protein
MRYFILFLALLAGPASAQDHSIALTPSEWALMEAQLSAPMVDAPVTIRTIMDAWRRHAEARAWFEAHCKATANNAGIADQMALPLGLRCPR